MEQQSIANSRELFRKIPDYFPASSSYRIEHNWPLLAAASVLAFGALTKDILGEIVAELLQKTASVQQDSASDDHSEQVSTEAVRRLREGLLKASPIVGFPRSINALQYLQAYLDEHAPTIRDRLKADRSLRGSVPLSERQSRGRAFFSSIYGKHTDRVLASMNESSGGDMGEFAVNCVYGDLVAETSILDSKETAMLEFVSCLALGKECAPQAKGHMYGAKNLGNNGSEIVAAINVVRSLALVLEASWSEKDFEFLEKAYGW